MMKREHSWMAVAMSAVLASLPATAVVRPHMDPELVHCPDDILQLSIEERLDTELANPAFDSVVRLVDFDSDENWTGSLISPSWILTCAHTIQGTNGQGGGVAPSRVFFNFGGTQFSPSNVAKRIIVHEGWDVEDYEGGDDIALIELMNPVTNEIAFPQLGTGPVQLPRDVVFVGYGKQGDGITGETGEPGRSRAIGINSWDALGGQTPTDGEGAPYPGIQSYSGNMAFMDFDRRRAEIYLCVPEIGDPFWVTNEVSESALSSMGEFNEDNAPMERCYDGGTVPGVFRDHRCDYLPAGGDSGSPAYAVGSEIWPFPPRPGGHYISSPPLLLGVASERLAGKAGVATSVYGNTISHTLVAPYLGWIYEQVPEVAERDSDEDGQTDEQEHLTGTDPYNEDSYFEVEPIWDLGLPGLEFTLPQIPGVEYLVEFQSHLPDLFGWGPAVLAGGGSGPVAGPSVTVPFPPEHPVGAYRVRAQSAP